MIIWIIGMSAAGKTVIGKELYKLVKEKYRHSVFIDGDIFRGLHDDDVKHSIEDRKRNSDRVCNMCQFLDQQDIHVVCSILSIFNEAQDWNRDNYKNYFEVYLDVSLDTLVERDPKGLYKGARSGEIPNVVGMDIDFTPPKNPDMIIKNEGQDTPEQIARKIFDELEFDDEDN